MSLQKQVKILPTFFFLNENLRPVNEILYMYKISNSFDTNSHKFKFYV